MATETRVAAGVEFADLPPDFAWSDGEPWPAWKTSAAMLALAMLFGLIEAAQLNLGSSVLGQGMPVGVAVARVMPYWVLAAGVMSLVVVLGRRFRVGQFVLRPNVPALAAAAVGFALLALAGRALLPTFAPGNAPLRPTPLQLFQTYFPLDLLTYTAFVATVYAFHYYRETRRREIAASKLQASLAEARLRGLEARVDPEFLFATLADISALASQGRQKPVIEMLGRLSEVLRAALSDERPDEIPLRQEVSLLHGYLSVSDSNPTPTLHIHRDVEAGALDALVPRMILPTILERVLGFDLANHEVQASITIGAARCEEALRLRVVSAAAPIREPRETELGLQDVREQLQRLYGRAQSLDLVADGSSLSVIVEIPFRPALAGEERSGTQTADPSPARA